MDIVEGIPIANDLLSNKSSNKSQEQSSEMTQKPRRIKSAAKRDKSKDQYLKPEDYSQKPENKKKIKDRTTSSPIKSEKKPKDKKDYIE